MVLVLDLKEVRSKDLLRVCSGYDKIKRKAALLVDNGLLTAFETDKPHPATTYMLTPKGREVAVLLKKARAILEDDSSQKTLDDCCRWER